MGNLFYDRELKPSDFRSQAEFQDYLDRKSAKYQTASSLAAEIAAKKEAALPIIWEELNLEIVKEDVNEFFGTTLVFKVVLDKLAPNYMEVVDRLYGHFKLRKGKYSDSGRYPDIHGCFFIRGEEA